MASSSHVRKDWIFTLRSLCCMDMMTLNGALSREKRRPKGATTIATDSGSFRPEHHPDCTLSTKDRSPPPPQARHLNREEPNTARAANMAPPARTGRPPTPPARRRWTSNTVEEEGGTPPACRRLMHARRTPSAPPAPSCRGPEQTDPLGPDHSQCRRHCTGMSRRRLPPPCALPRQPPPPSEPVRVTTAAATTKTSAVAPSTHPSRAPATRPPDPAGAAPDLGARASSAAGAPARGISGGWTSASAPGCRRERKKGPSPPLPRPRGMSAYHSGGGEAGRAGRR
jgi:hypothetical protein